MKQRRVNPDFDVTIRLRNNHLVSFRETMGWSTHEFAAKIGVSYPVYLDYESMRRRPFNKLSGHWKDTAQRIADFMGVSPDEVWPEVILRVQTNTATIKMDGEQALALAGFSYNQLPSPEEVVSEKEMKTAVHTALQKLTPREQKVIKNRFGIDTDAEPMTYDECAAEDAGFSSLSRKTRERMRQIEQRALRRLRLGVVGNTLETFVDNEG